MKYNYMQKTTRAGFPRVRIETDRAAILAILAGPGILAIIAFIVAVALTAFGVPTKGTLRSTVAALAYLYLTVCVMWLPAYLISYAWYWRMTRDDAGLLKWLWRLPLVAALFVWFPSVVFSEMPRGQLWHVLMPFILTALVSFYVWVGVARLMFYAWRRK